MNIRGIATALYDKGDRRVVSLTELNSTSAENIFIERTEKREIEPGNIRQLRHAMHQVLNCAADVKSQIFSRGNDVVVPVTPITFGVAEDHPALEYLIQLQAAFPKINEREYEFTRHPALSFLHDLILQDFRANGQPNAMIAVNPHFLYTQKDERVQGMTLSGDDRRYGNVLSAVLEYAKRKNPEALYFLQEAARRAAREQIAECVQRRMEPPRFFQVGLHTPEFKNCARYTFLEHYDLKDVYVAELMRHMTPHNICVKTPNDEPAPPFSDICATYLADAWDIVTGNKQKKHVFARKAPKS